MEIVDNFINKAKILYDHSIAWHITIIVVLAILALYAMRGILPWLRHWLVKQQDSREDIQRITTLARVVRHVLTTIIFVVAGISILGELGIAVGPILGAAGVVGVAIGFGAQTLVKDYLAGFFLLLENQIRMGDIVEISGKSGVVEELTLRYVRLRDYAGVVHYIPNSQITVVSNLSVEYANAVIEVGVGYDSDISVVMEVLRGVAEEMRGDTQWNYRILKDIEIDGVESWADSSVIIRSRLRVIPLEQFNVRREFLRRLKPAFDRAGIEIPFPHRTMIMPPVSSDAPRSLVATTETASTAQNKLTKENLPRSD